MVRKPRAYKRAIRKRQIITQLQIWHQNGFANEATSYRLAKALDVRPSQKFRDILNEMIADGDLLCEDREQSGRFVTRFYLLADRHIITEKFSRRHITVKSRGQAVGQLELFS